jgi:hypothetical protein
MMHRLIEDCYKNKYNIDLKKIQIDASKISPTQKKLTINDLTFYREKFTLSDGLSSFFELVYYNDLLYLLGNKSCYPCGNIHEGAYGIVWVSIFIIPTGLPIKVFRDIRQSCCVNADPINSYLTYLTADNFREFINDYTHSFKDNDWYGHNRLRFLIISYDLIPVNETFNELRRRNLLNPFELALGSIIYDLGITPLEVFNCLNYSKDISPPFTYIDYFKTKFSLSESTNQLIRTDEFKKIIESFDSNEVEQFFEVQYLIENLRLKNFYSELMADVLQIRILNRLCRIDPFCNPAKLLQKRFDRVNIVRTVINEFYGKIKTNIRNLENQVRKNSGYKEVGSIYNEMLIFKFFTDNFKTYDVAYQYSPQWLGRQRFDVYIKSLNIAIEYNGKQHYEPVDFFGGIEGFNNTIKRDQEKRRKCGENSCVLIEIKYNEDIDLALSIIKIKINSFKI